MMKYVNIQQDNHILLDLLIIVQDFKQEVKNEWKRPPEQNNLKNKMITSITDCFS